MLSPALPAARDAHRDAAFDIARAADRCVRCGLCSARCPTYAAARDENDAPRGRISLMDGLARGVLAPEPALRRHLERCLLCRACEDACPAGVPFGRMMDAARARLAGDRPQGALVRLTARPRLWRALAALLRVARAAGLVGWAQRTRAAARLGLNRLQRLTDTLAPRKKGPVTSASRSRFAGRVRAGTDENAAHLSPGPPLETVWLFPGCSDDLLAPGAVAAAGRVLAAAGLRLRNLPGAGCCGALARHAGAGTKADTLARRNAAAAEGRGPVVFLSSGCGVELAAGGGDWREICAFADTLPGLERLSLRPLPGVVAWHRPCTHRRLPDAGAAAGRLLARIPGLTVVPLEAACCGAGGTVMLDHPELADAVTRTMLDGLPRETRWIATTNAGCLAQIRRHLPAGVEVVHPLELLARQLPD